MNNYGIPYQGSKGRFAPMIYRAINARHPDGAPRTLLDPFCGGLAVSHYFRLRGWQVKPSDLDPYTVALLNAALNDDLGDIQDEWITREQFERARDRPQGMTAAEVGFIRQVWSFGNTGTTYLYGRHLEEVKRLAHGLVVKGETSDRLAVLSGVSVRVQERVARLGSAKARRRAWQRAAADGTGTVTQKASVAQMSERKRGERVASLASLQHAAQGARVARLKAPGLTVRVQDYREAIRDMPMEHTLYCDPPYAGTKSYIGVDRFDHEEFWDLMTERAASGTRVYVSEYSAPDGWEPILAFTRQNTLAADSRAKTTYHREKLYTYKGRDA